MRRLVVNGEERDRGSVRERRRQRKGEEEEGGREQGWETSIAIVSPLLEKCLSLAIHCFCIWKSYKQDAEFALMKLKQMIISADNFSNYIVFHLCTILFP